MLSLANWQHETVCLEDVGSEALWENLTIKIDVSSDLVDLESLTVKAMDHNSARANAFIGSGTTTLSRVYQTLDNPKFKEIDIVVDLDNENKSAGKAIFYCSLQRHVAQSSILVEISELLKSGTMYIKRIRADNLKNVELQGKSDPYLILNFDGGTTSMQTQVRDGGGSSVCWDHLDFKYENITKERLIDGFISVEVWDKNRMKDALIGTGRVSVRLAGGVLDEVVELTISLEDKKGGSAGQVVLDVLIREGVEIEDEAIAGMGTDLQVTKGFVCGKAHIKRICVFDAANTEIIGNQVCTKCSPSCFIHVTFVIP
jgi:hypothetical protein